MREVEAPSTDCAIARASTVLAVPGTSSKSTWPSQAIAARTRLILLRLPWMTVSMLSSRRSATADAWAKRSEWAPTSCSVAVTAALPWDGSLAALADGLGSVGIQSCSGRAQAFENVTDSSRDLLAAH